MTKKLVYMVRHSFFDGTGTGVEISLFFELGDAQKWRRAIWTDRSDNKFPPQDEKEWTVSDGEEFISIEEQYIK